MKNFIQTRIQSFSPSKIFARIKHNMRKVKSLNTISDAYNIMINPKTGELIELNDKSVIDDYYNKKHERKYNLKKNKGYYIHNIKIAR